MTEQSVVWTGDNLYEIAEMLHGFVAVVERSGDWLRISGPDGMELEIKAGETLIVDRDNDRVGVLRELTEPPKTVTVSCANCQKPMQVLEDALASKEVDFVVCGEICLNAIAGRMNIQIDRKPN